MLPATLHVHARISCTLRADHVPRWAAPFTHAGACVLGAERVAGANPLARAVCFAAVAGSGVGLGGRCVGGGMRKAQPISKVVQEGLDLCVGGVFWCVHVFVCERMSVCFCVCT